MISLLLTALQMAAQAPQHPANHLKDETSPYLASHAYNPVDWYPWGEEALDRAKAEDKPIFLSIGYSACHWCHVMERESFENEEVAAILNRHFIAIKVDREERPDLDDLYMTAVQRMTGQGGWPMSVWLTPELLPFYGGTYFPPESRYGKPGFKDLLTQLAATWKDRRAEIEEAAKQVDGQLAVDFPALADGMVLPEADILTKREARWVREFARDYDPVDGGFGQAPKFPRADDVRFLLAVAARQPDSAEGADALRMAVHTLKAMASGGMIDRLAGGFARYSVDAQWLIPHFEKMLYDQGTLLPAYLEGWRLSGDEELAQIARETADYLLRERQDPGGAFWSATDADSEGVEGKYFVWTPEQLEAALGEEDGRFAAALYGVTAGGNFEHGWSVLTAAKSPREAAAALGMDEDGAEARAASVRERLLAARAERIAPLSDDKILLSWNGLAIDALARAGRMLDEPRYTAAAVAAGDFLVATFKQENDRWLRSHRVGRTAHRAVLEDHAYALRGFLELFMGTGDERWLAESESLAAAMLRDFGDEETGLFWDTDGQDPALRHRLKTPWDGATPAPNAVAIEGLLMLHAFTGEERWREPAVRSLLALTELVERQPRSFSATLRLYAWAVQEPAVAVVVGTGSAASLARWRRELAGRDYADALPVLLPAPPVGSERSLFAARPAVDGKPTLYLCVAQVCKLPRTLE